LHAAVLKADAVDVEEPSLPRRRRRPRRYEMGDASPHFAATVEDHLNFK